MDTKNCATCGAPFTPRHYDRPNRFCSSPCYQASRAGKVQKADVVGQRMRRVPGHPIAPPSGTVAVARLVLYEKIGPGEHPCHWCGALVKWIAGGHVGTPGSLMADHLDWDRANDAPENLVPSCNHCNAHRTAHGGRAPLRHDELTMMWGGARTRAVRRYCNHCGTEFLTIPAEVRKGHGRYCSRSCARRAPRS